MPARPWREISAAESADAAWIVEHYRELAAQYRREA
jgi:hypothetical protein